MSCLVYVLAQQKGGVGKTTTTVNLGAALAEQGQKVLLIDMDPQGALSAVTGIDMLKVSDLAAAEMGLANEPARDLLLREKLSDLEGYTRIIIDCPPSLGFLTLNALAAASRIIIPVQTQFLALRGMEILMETINKVKLRINRKMKISGILPTMVDSRTVHSKEALEQLKESYGSLVFETVIPQTVKVSDSTLSGKPLLCFNPTSLAAKAYRSLALEVENREKAII
ncbi:MAG: chromosome partitioning protein [bacterium]|nr:MAG: chromosome partitioning protein [bacterium]